MYIKKVIRKNLDENLFFVGILKATDEKKQDPNPDPNPNPDPETKVSGTYPRIRIRTKMSRIHNTDFLRAYSYGVKKEKKNSRKRTRIENKNQKVLWYRYGCTQQIHRK
jgi:hypothetical protein